MTAALWSGVGIGQDVVIEAMLLRAMSYPERWQWLIQHEIDGFLVRAILRKNIVHGGIENMLGDVHLPLTFLPLSLEHPRCHVGLQHRERIAVTLRSSSIEKVKMPEIREKRTQAPFLCIIMMIQVRIHRIPTDCGLWVCGMKLKIPLSRKTLCGFALRFGVQQNLYLRFSWSLGRSFTWKPCAALCSTWKGPNHLDCS